MLQHYHCRYRTNALGGHEDHLIRDDHTRREIEEVITEVFGEEAMGFRAQDDQSDRDPFDSSSDDSSSEEMDAHSESNVDDIISDLDLDRGTNSVAMCTPDASDADSVLAPDFQAISDGDDHSF